MLRAALLLLLVTGHGCASTPVASPTAGPTTADLAFVAGQAIALPAPDRSGGLPLMAALDARRSTRDFRPDPLPLTLVSELLWAANGINRPDEGKRTAATARNWQNLTVYVVMASGVFRYDPAPHALVPFKPGDLRALTGKQPLAGEVPVDLVYVSDQTPMADVEDEVRKGIYDGIHAGIVAENVSLYAASAGLGTVIRAYFDGPALTAALGLGPTERVVLAQSVGLPKDGAPAR